MGTVYVYSKSLNNTLKAITHLYFTIPSMGLEIHPGQFFYGTHHTIGMFRKNSVCIGEKTLCKKCMEILLKESNDLTEAWYYPIINCESMTRGLLYSNPISIQTIFLTIIVTFFIIGLIESIYLYICLIFIILLILFNNVNILYSVDVCPHYIELAKSNGSYTKDLGIIRNTLSPPRNY